jgi:hypothetical protein
MRATTPKPTEREVEGLALLAAGSWTLESGREFWRDGAPAFSIHRIAPQEEPAELSPSEVDDVAHAIDFLIRSQRVGPLLRVRQLGPACQTLLSLSIDPCRDYHELNWGEVQGIASAAGTAGYRKPANFPGSTARAYYEKLQRAARKGA